MPVMSAAGRLNTPGPEQSAHRAVREDALKGQVAGQGVSFHSFVFPDFLQHLVLSLTEFIREEDPGSMQPRGRLHVHSLRVTFDPSPTPRLADLLRPVAAWIPDPLIAGDERRRPTQHTGP